MNCPVPPAGLTWCGLGADLARDLAQHQPQSLAGPFPHRTRLVRRRIRRPRSSTMTDPKARDYSETLFLPKTGFPMRAGLPQKEPEILARWQTLGLYARLRATAA